MRIFSYLQLSNLGNADTINIYNSATQDGTTRVDSLSYDSVPNELSRGSGISRNRPVGGAGQSPNTAWLLSAAGDAYGSLPAPNPIYPMTEDSLDPDRYQDLANPGIYPVPEPATWQLPAAVMLMLIPNAVKKWTNRELRKSGAGASRRPMESKFPNFSVGV